MRKEITDITQKEEKLEILINEINLHEKENRVIWGRCGEDDYAVIFSAENTSKGPIIQLIEELECYVDHIRFKEKTRRK